MSVTGWNIIHIVGILKQDVNGCSITEFVMIVWNPSAMIVVTRQIVKNSLYNVVSAVRKLSVQTVSLYLNVYVALTGYVRNVRI